MKIGEIIIYKDYKIKKVKWAKDKCKFLNKDIGLYFETLNKAKKFIDNMGKDAVTIKLDKVLGALNNYIEKGE
jgi:hypothetical protein